MPTPTRTTPTRTRATTRTRTIPAGTTLASTQHTIPTFPPAGTSLAAASAAGVPLASLLGGGVLTRGQAITVLVPLLQTLHGVHRMHCTHGAVSVAGITIDSTGRAHLADWASRTDHSQPGDPALPDEHTAPNEHGATSGHSVPAGYTAPRGHTAPSGHIESGGFRRRSGAIDPSTIGASDFDVGRRSDFRQLLEVVTAVLGAAGVERGTLSPVFDELEHGAAGRLDEFAPFFEDWLFALAPPEPLHRSGPFDWQGLGAAALDAVEDDVSRAVADDRARARIGPRIHAARRALARAAATLADTLWRSIRHGRRVRPKTVLTMVVVGTGALLGALLTLPTADATGHPSLPVSSVSPTPATPTPPISPAAAPAVEPTARTPSAQLAAPSPSAPTAAPSTSPTAPTPSAQPAAPTAPAPPTAPTPSARPATPTPSAPPTATTPSPQPAAPSPSARGEPSASPETTEGEAAERATSGPFAASVSTSTAVSTSETSRLVWSALRHGGRFFAPAAIDVTMGDDAVRAAVELVRRREECALTSDPVCFESVDEPESVFMRADLAGAAGSAQTEALRIVVQDSSERPAMRTGDAAVVAVGVQASGETMTGAGGAAPTQTAPRGGGEGATPAQTTPRGGGVGAAPTTPASLLLVKGEAGWRIRQLFGQ